MRSFVKAPASGLWWPVLAVVLLMLGACGGDGSKSKYAGVRLLNVSTDYPSLDMYVNDGEGGGDTLKAQGVAYETVSSYAKSGASTFSVVVKRNGVTSGTLATLTSQKQADDTHVTYVGYGTSGRFGILRINDDITAANENKTKVEILNATQAGTLDVYLTDPSVALTDASPQISALASGSSSGTIFMDSGTYRLRVVGTGDTEDLRLDIPDVVLSSKQIVSVILTATPGGAMVSAVVLPQQGAPIFRHNPNARVRGAIGTTAGVNLGIGGVTLLTGAQAGVVSSHYSLAPAGSAAAVDLQVGGVAVAVPTQQLVAGGDYTLLVWSNASGPHLTVVSDDNRPPTSGKAKLRVLNGISGTDTPVTMAVDFLPVAEGIADGQASGYTEFDTTTDSAIEYQIDVSDANTTTSLVRKTDVTLTGDSVYSLLVSGATTFNGTLRKDR